MKYHLISLFVGLTIILGNHSTAHAAPEDAIDQMSFFTGSTPNHIPRHIGLITDKPTYKSIAARCMAGASFAELESLGVDSLQQRLELLAKDSLLVNDNGKYFLTIPVIVGEKRELLRQITKDGAVKLMPAVDSLISRLKPALKDRQDVLFHILWSRVIDANWWPLYFGQFPEKQSPPAMVWVVFPQHSYQVGTNFWSMPDQDELAITWGYGCQDCLGPIQESRLYLIGESSHLSDSASIALLERGCIDSMGHSRIYSFRDGGNVDNLFQELKKQYTDATHNLYDYQSLSREFGIPVDELFVILMHETAYSIFENLNQSGKLPFPSVLQPTGHIRTCVQLASIRTYGLPYGFILGNVAIAVVIIVGLWVFIARKRIRSRRAI